MEDALKKLDRLTQEEARMALAEVLKVTHDVRDGVQCVDERVQVNIDGAQGMSTQSPMTSNIVVFRGQGSKIDHSTGGKRDRRSQVFVTSLI